MNQGQRDQLDKIIDRLRVEQSALEVMAADEQEKYDNLSESLQGAENGQKLEAIASTLSEAQEALQTLIDELDGIE